MRAFALVGPSGSGKSHKAMQVAFENDIDLIIDDGLLIHGTKKLAGKSAKREKTKIAAVKRALFSYEDHKDDVVKVLDELREKSILIIGTSVKMVNIIGSQLGVLPFERIIFIEEVSTKEEIDVARYFRKKHGKHVIPLPQVEIKRDFSGYVKDTVKSILGRTNSQNNGESIVHEKTVIRPTFSYLGNYTISNRTLIQIVKAVGDESKGIINVSRVVVNLGEGGLTVNAHITVGYNMNMMSLVEKFQKRLVTQIEDMTMINVLAANILIKNVRYF